MDRLISTTRINGQTCWGVAACAVPLAHGEKARAQRAGDLLEEGREELVVGHRLGRGER